MSRYATTDLLEKCLLKKLEQCVIYITKKIQLCKNNTYSFHKQMIYNVFKQIIAAEFHFKNPR